MATQLLSMEEIARHKDSTWPPSIWIVIHDSVYDVTAFLDKHPGGAAVLLKHAGQEATKAFEDVRHSSKARELMKKFKVGELRPDEVVANKADSIKDQVKRFIIGGLLPGAVKTVDSKKDKLIASGSQTGHSKTVDGVKRHACPMGCPDKPRRPGEPRPASPPDEFSISPEHLKMGLLALLAGLVLGFVIKRYVL